MRHTSGWSLKIADTIIARFQDPLDYPYNSWSYPHGFMLWGMIKMWEYSGIQKYCDYAMLFAERSVDQDGNITRYRGNSLDDIMAASVIAWAYDRTHLEKYRKACDTVRKTFDSYPRMAGGEFWHADWAPNEMWVDGLFMGQMFLTKYAQYIGDSKYCFDEGARQLMMVYNHCSKGDTGLLLHAWSENGQPAWADPETGCSPEVWSEGLGWYAMMLVEFLEIMPKDHIHRDRIIWQLEKLLNSLKSTQGAQTGLWYQVVDKGDLKDNWQDSSGSSMFVYTVRKAIELGLADEEIYGPVADRGYEGIITKAVINSEGFVDINDACDGLGVQNNYDAYIKFEKTINAKEAVAAFLWATGIMEK